MIEGRPSHTAFQVAAARAAHLRFDPAPHVLEDRLAEQLLDDEGRAIIDSYGDDAPWILLENRLFLPLRARYVEDRLAAAYARGVRQLVVLGAGLDSFAWRCPDTLSALHIFEVDHPSTQSWKHARLEALGWSIPESTRLVPCDFEHQTALQALAATDFDPDAPAIVSWMGGVCYLERATADAAMRELAEGLAPESEVVFDTMLPWERLPERYQALREEMTRYLKGAGEPHINRYAPEDLVAALLAAGFSEAEIVARETLLHDYVQPAGADLPVSDRFFLAVARR